VLQVITDRDRRGAQVFAVDLAPGLEALGCEVTTVALAAGTRGDSLPVEVLGPSQRSWRTFRALRGAAKQHDLVIAHGSSTLLACAVALVGTGIPFVYRQISDPLVWAGTLLRRIRVALLLRRASCVVALTDGLATVVRRHYRLSAERVRVIPNAVPGSRFRPPSPHERAGARAELGAPQGRLLVAAVGSLSPEKGFDLAIEAVAELADVSLVIAGAGPERQSLEQRAERCAPGRVVFLGQVPDSVHLYWAADVVLVPSRTEAMPAVVIEAGLCGVPLVATDVGSIREVLGDGEGSRIVAANDPGALTVALAAALRDHSAERLKAENVERRLRSRYTIEVASLAWLDVIEASGRVRHGRSA
jgi:glycosyltransferase involved in cell wall biosynthesis